MVMEGLLTDLTLHCISKYCRTAAISSPCSSSYSCNTRIHFCPSTCTPVSWFYRNSAQDVYSAIYWVISWIPNRCPYWKCLKCFRIGEFRGRPSCCSYDIYAYQIKLALLVVICFSVLVGFCILRLLIVFDLSHLSVCNFNSRLIYIIALSFQIALVIDYWSFGAIHGQLPFCSLNFLSFVKFLELLHCLYSTT